MPRLLHIGASLVIVLVAYWAYALVAVPLIEPSTDLQAEAAISPQQRERANQEAAARVKRLEGLFPPGAWELENPKILESDRVILLIQQYQTRDKNLVEIPCCTVVFMPDATVTDEVQRKRQAVVLEAPEGALLEFDEAFDLPHMKIGRLKAGKLQGRITIRSGGKLPGPEDDLLIVAHDVDLQGHDVTAAKPVDFRLGPHHGRGRGMHIRLLPDEEAPSAGRHGPDIGGVDWFEMEHIEQLHVELGQEQLGSLVGQAASLPKSTVEQASSLPKSVQSQVANQPPHKTPSDLPVDIICQGPFRFDVRQKQATFSRQVVVSHANPEGPADQLNCESLTLFFTERPPAAPKTPADAQTPPPKQRGGPLDLQPQRVEALGAPVIVNAPGLGPNKELFAKAERLEFELQTKRIALESKQEVTLRQGPNEVHAKNLQYQSAGPKRLGRIEADGPGWLRGQMSKRTDQMLEARWQEKLRLRPDEQNQVISLTGGASLKTLGVGQLDANEIHFWMVELPPKEGSDRPQLRPDRLLAHGKVRVDSPQLSSSVEQLEVWFEPMPAGPPKVRWKTEGKAEGKAAGIQKTEDRSHKTEDSVRRGAPDPADQGLDVGWLPPTRHMDVVGRLVRVRVLIGAEQLDDLAEAKDQPAEVAELTVEEGVRLVETQTALPDERPLLVSGDRLHVVDANRPHTAVTVVGRPAHFEGRGLGLTGSNINLNRGTNRLWIDGPGQMEVPMDRDLEGRPLPKPGTLEIQWQESMAFDGRTARFEESVVASEKPETAPAPPRQIAGHPPAGAAPVPTDSVALRRLETETIEVQFARPIDFADLKGRQQQPQIEQVLCRGGVLMESIAGDGQSQTARERVQVVDLGINPLSGALTAGGPGSLVSVRRGGADLFTGQFGGPLAGERDDPVVQPAAATTPDERLHCLHVRFQGSLSGNLRQQQITFHDDVQTAYAPVDSWGAVIATNDPEAVGPDGFVMRCDHLTVTRMPTPAGDRRTAELVAAGNTVAEGRTFFARGARITYAEAKGLLILEGDGRSDAELMRQEQVGGPRTQIPAQKIYFLPKTRQFKIEGARGLQIDQVPSRLPGGGRPSAPGGLPGKTSR